MKYRLWLLLFFSVLIALVTAELTLRLLDRNNDRLCVFPPNLRYKFEPDSSILWGCNGTKNFSTNEYGARQINSDAAPSMLFIGGSTTECLYLDDIETWPARLCKAWHCGGQSIGKSGQTTREHVWQMQYYLPQLKRVQQVVVFCGLNDLLKVLSDTARLNNEIPMDTAAYRAVFTSTAGFPSQNRLRLLGLLQRAYRNVIPDTTGQYRQDQKGQIVTKWRQNRSNAALLIGDTSFASAHRARGLQVFRSNIRTMIAAAKAQKVSITFITPISAWGDTSVENKKRCWMGGLGDFQRQPHCAYYTFQFLNAELLRYNEALLEECKAAGVRCLDVRGSCLPPGAFFYDDCHFHAAGAARFAAIVQEKMKYNH